MAVYLGQPGRLHLIKAPLRDFDLTVERQSSTRVTIGGGRVTDYAPGVLRSWSLPWTWLDRDDRGTILALFAGHHGPGPWCLIDGVERNLLTAQQSSATAVEYDTSGFACTSRSVLTSWPTGPGSARGPRALLWSLLTGTTAGTLYVLAPWSGWPGIPVVPGLVYRWQCDVTSISTVAPTVTAGLSWMDANGVVLSTTAGTATATGWSAVSAAVQAAAPAAAVYVRPVLSSASMPASGTVGLPDPPGVSGPEFTDVMLLVDRPHLAMPTASDDGTTWAPGLGVPRVTLPGLSQTVMLSTRYQAELTIVEVVR